MQCRVVWQCAVGAASLPCEALPTVITGAVIAYRRRTEKLVERVKEKVSEVAHGNVQLFDAAANAYKNRVTDIQLKSMEFVQLNINSGFAFARKLFAVRDPSEAVNLQQSFLKEHAETMQRQAAELENGRGRGFQRSRVHHVQRQRHGAGTQMRMSSNDEIIALAGRQGLELMTWIAMRGALQGRVSKLANKARWPRTISP